MILYNTTFVMAPLSEGAFLEFMQEVYLPALAQDDLIKEGSLRLHRIRQQDEEVDSISYALHFYTQSTIYRTSSPILGYVWQRLSSHASGKLLLGSAP